MGSIDDGGDFTRFFHCFQLFVLAHITLLTKMSPSSLGLHIMDPRVLSDQVGDDGDGDHHHQQHLHSIL
jgi:hypothetical protein